MELTVKSLTTTGQLRSFNRPFDSPRKFCSTANSNSKNFLTYTSMPCQFCHSVFFSLIYKYHICTAIIGLLLFRCPTAISRFIVSIIIRPTVESIISWWPFTHVIKEILESKPAITDFYSQFLIMLISRIRWICAPRNHIMPTAKSWRTFSANGVTMCGINRLHILYTIEV